MSGIENINEMIMLKEAGKLIVPTPEEYIKSFKNTKPDKHGHHINAYEYLKADTRSLKIRGL